MINRNVETKQKWGFYVIVSVVIFALSLTSCSYPPSPPPPVTDLPVTVPPVVDLVSPPEQPVTYPAGPEITVEPGKNLSIRAESNGATRFEWQLAGDGNISATDTPAILYTPPGTDTEAIITVTAYNDAGASPSTSITIKVSRIAAIPLDAVGIPAGFFVGSGSPSQFINLKGGDSNECRPNVNCLRVTYKPGGSFGGIFYWPLKCGETGNEDAWKMVREGTCGINVLDAGNLKTINRLTFWAKGDQGGEVVEFKVGAADVIPSPGWSLGKVPLTSEWEPYEIDLVGADLTNAIGLFIWAATDIDNPQGAVFYLSEIQFEGVK